MSCENMSNNKSRCNCTYVSCPRHGLCCECVAYHNKSGEFPACFFSKEAEATYNRSFDMLKKDRKKNV